MARPKRWYDPNAATALRLIARAEYDESWSLARWRHARVSPGLGECLLYPLSDGPGLGLLVFLPPIMWVLSLPVYDVIAFLHPITKRDWALGLLIMPVMMPMLFSFAMTFGYVLLFLGHMLVASSLGENDHPRWPEWHPSDISEGIGRWVWAALFGLALGGGPLMLYWLHRGETGLLDWVVLLGLITLGVGYAQMALAAALLHDNIVAANPVTVLSAIARIGWDYLQPCLVAALALVMAGVGLWGMLYWIPSRWAEAFAIWAFWVFLFYAAMVVMRMVGLTYHAHAMDLHWFRRRPRWASSRRDGRLYANS
jgi:hypothetical protein